MWTSFHSSILAHSFSHSLVALNNKYYREPELSISIGASTSTPGISLEKAIGLADDAMYLNKSEHHRRRKDDR